MALDSQRAYETARAFPDFWERVKHSCMAVRREDLPRVMKEGTTFYVALIETAAPPRYSVEQYELGWAVMDRYQSDGRNYFCFSTSKKNADCVASVLNEAEPK